MTNESSDAIAMLAAVVENEGGSYTLPIEALEAVVEGEKGISLESFDGGQTVTMTLVTAEEVENA